MYLLLLKSSGLNCQSHLYNILILKWITLKKTLCSLTSNPKTTANCKYVFHARARGRICQMNRTYTLMNPRGSSKFTEMLGKENSPISLSSFSWSQNRSWTDRAYRNQQIDRPESPRRMRFSTRRVLDVPLLIEGRLWKWVGLVIVVYR